MTSQRRRRVTIGCTAAIVGMALMALTIWPRINSYLLARELTSLGCEYSVRTVTSGHSPWATFSVTTIVLRGSQIDDDWLESHGRQFVRTRSLELIIDGTRCSCRGLEIVGGLPNLRSMSLKRVNVSEDCVVGFCRPQVLTLDESMITDEGIASLILLPNGMPFSLTVPGRNFGPRSMAALKKTSAVRDVTISNATNKTIEMLVSVNARTSCHLTLQGEHITDASLPDLLKIRTKVYLVGHGLSEQGRDSVINNTSGFVSL